MPDLTPPNMPQNPTIQSAGGNCVLQDIGNGFAAFYAHFSPGSIKVARGERVRKGQVLGLLGNSGNSSGPHLHFHIVKGRLGIAANGFPYVVDSFKLKGQADSKDGLQTELTKPEVPVNILLPQTPGRHRNEMPADLAVVEF
jgi:murein DD-endopeptidase MepM/ murein hydrolase activator NlpD